MGMEWEPDELRDILERAKETAIIATQLTAQEFLGDVKEETPVKKGNLQNSWVVEPLDPLNYRFYNNAEYALSVHDGSRPHKIEAKNKEALNVPGYGIFKSVWHPGNIANPFTINAMLKTELKIPDFVEMALQQTGTG